MNRLFKKSKREKLSIKKQKEQNKKDEKLWEQINQQNNENLFNQFDEDQFSNQQFQANQQQQNQKIVQYQIKNFQGQKIFPQEQYEGDLQQALNYHLIKMIFSYLNGFELVQASQVCQYFNQLIRFQSYKEEKNTVEVVWDNGIMKYMEVDLDKIKDQNLIALKVVVSSRDQGWASASYSSSWVTLKLIKHGEDNLDHCADSQNLDEIMIVENHSVMLFKIHTIIITPFENKNEKLTKFFNHIREGNYDKLAIVMKCQYAGWVCQIQKACIEFVMLKKD